MSDLAECPGGFFMCVSSSGELWTTAPDNHPSDGKGVVTGTVTMIAKKGTTASAEDIEKAPMWQMVWHFYVTAEGDEKVRRCAQSCPPAGSRASTAQLCQLQGYNSAIRRSIPTLHY